ncbi:proton-coupled folate transporter-like [Tigriopus californicus]|uniref:proton-coupled folate transporter-like n=1 Tax=Tigriopus californicus TaxID=6832 RepID=UPI0027DA56F3|nr:proton-coupled folate transporter-like [Tigriopus californicus]
MRNLGQCFCVVFKNITVEPVLFLYMLGVYLLYSVFQNLVYEKVCLEHNNSTVCADLYHPDHEDQLTLVQQEASYWIKVSTFAMVLPSIVVDCYMGSWSDVFGRKPTLLLPPFGAFLGALVYCYMEAYSSHVGWICLASFFFGMFGSFTGILTAVLAYMSVVSPLKQRTTRISILLSMNFLAGTTGPFASGYLATNFSPLFVFVCIAACHLLCMSYTLIFVDNIYPNGMTKPLEWNWTQIFSLGHLKSSFRICFVERSGNEKRNILVLLVMLIILQLITAGEMDIVFLFLKDKPIKMEFQMFSYWFGSRYGMSSLMLLVLMPILKQTLKVQDKWVCLMGLLSKMSALTLLSFSFSVTMAFWDVPLGCFGSFAITSMRSMLSQNVEEHEQGEL